MASLTSIANTLFYGVIALALVLLPGCDSCTGRRDSNRIALSVNEETLPNGLRVVVSEDPHSPVISYQTWFRVGSVDEEIGKTGLAHLFEHLMFKGTLKNPSGSFYRRLEARGAEVNAYTTRDYTVYFVNASPSLLDEIIELEADRMMGLAIDEARLETEKQVVMEERRLRIENEPGGRVEEALWQLTYSSHPYQWPVIGYPQDLEKETVDDLKAFYQKYYRPSNATLVVTGAVRATEVIEKVKKAYGALPTLPASERKIVPEPQQTEPRSITLYDHVGAERFAVGYVVSDAKSPDSSALDVLCNILFGGVSSRVHRRLMEENEWVTSVSGSAFTPGQPGLLAYSATMRSGVKSQVAMDAIEALIREVGEKGVSDDELTAAVKQLKADRIDSVRTPSGLAQLLGVVTTLLGGSSRYNDDIDAYSKVTSNRVRDVVAKYLKKERSSTVLFLPEELTK